MLHHLRRLLRSLYEIPVIGGLVLWVTVALRLPTLQRRQVELAARLQGAEEAALRQDSATSTRFAESDARVAQLTERLAAIEALLAGVDVAQLAKRLAEAEALLARIDAAAQENLVMSVPVALRRNARDIAELRAQVGQAPGTPTHGPARENA
jgi:hypothetical protein